MSGSSVRTSVAVVLLFLTLAVAARAEGTAESALILLDSQIIDTSRPQHLTAEAVAAADDGSGEEVVLVKFPGPVTAGQQRALAASGVRVYTYLPHHAYLAKAPAGWRQEKAARLGASWTGLWLPSYKISRGIAAMTQVEPGDLAKIQPAPEDYRPVMLHVLPDADVRDLAERLEELGLHGITASKQRASFSRLRLLLSPAEIAAHRDALAALGEVFWIELEPRRVLLNDTTVWVGQSGLSGGQTTPIFSQGIFGEGQTIAVLDTGIDPDMCWFRDPALGLPPTNACNGGTVVNNSQRKVIAVDFLWQTECNGGISTTEWDTQDHGSHVAGTAAGDNFANLLIHNTADGMAPGAKLVVQDAGFLTDNCGDLPGIGCPVVDLNPIFQQAYSQGARIHTNSWGDNENAAVQNNYSNGSQDVDEFMWNHKDFLIFFAAGNSGPAPARSAARQRRRTASRSAPRCAAPPPSPWPRSPVAARPPTGGSSRRSPCPGRASSRRTTTSTPPPTTAAPRARAARAWRRRAPRGSPRWCGSTSPKGGIPRGAKTH